MYFTLDRNTTKYKLYMFVRLYYLTINCTRPHYQSVNLRYAIYTYKHTISIYLHTRTHIH